MFIDIPGDSGWNPWPIVVGVFDVVVAMQTLINIWYVDSRIAVEKVPYSPETMEPKTMLDNMTSLSFG